MNELDVYLDGVLAGVLTETSTGRAEFAYDPVYRASDDPTPSSRSIPLRATRVKPAHVQNFLAGLLPDNERTLARWAREYGTTAANPFRLLRHVGADTAGAVQILPPGTDATDAGPRRRRVEWLSQGQLRDTIANLRSRNDADWAPEGRKHGRWSLAGAQNKVALFRDGDRWGIPLDSTPTNCIVRTLIDGFGSHDLNEYASLKVASRIGLAAARVELLHIGNERAIVVERYDRYPDEYGVWHRLHQEDLCQALGVHPHQKYQLDGGPSPARIRQVLQDCDPESTGRFFDYIVYNVTIGATDAHAKNYSIIRDGSDNRLAPLYDVASVWPYEKAPVRSAGLHEAGPTSAMRVGKNLELAKISESDFRLLGRDLGLSDDESTQRCRRIRAAAPGAFEEFADEHDGPDGEVQWLRDLSAAIARHQTTARAFAAGSQ